MEAFFTADVYIWDALLFLKELYSKLEKMKWVVDGTLEKVKPKKGIFSNFIWINFVLHSLWHQILNFCLWEDEIRKEMVRVLELWNLSEI